MAIFSLKRQGSALAFLLLGFSVTASAASNASVPNSITLKFPNSPPPRTQILDGTFQSFSIEYAYMADFGGNLTYPNLLSYRLLQNLFTISGSNSYIRAGGSSGNLPIYNPNQTTGVINGFSTPGADQPDKVSIGPSWYQSFMTFPAGTMYVYQVNYRDNSSVGVANTIADAGRAFDALGSNLLSFELGNEMEGWANRGRGPNWDAAVYVQDWLNYTSKIGPQVFGPEEFSFWEPRYQAGVFEGLGGTGFNASKNEWNAEFILQQGIDDTGRVKSISIHDYMGAACADSTAIATLAGNLMNHDRVTYIVYPHALQATYTVAQGVEYVLGETNSISCQGEDGISNVFGSALWIVDYQLYTATTNVSRMYFHQGTPYRYSAWQPIPYLGLPASARPMYYGNLFMAQLFQGGHKQVSILTNTTYFTSYGMYTNGRLSDVAVVNLQMWNQTEVGSRPFVKVTLPQAGGGDNGKRDTAEGNVGGAEVRRLTAPGADSKGNITFAGRVVNADGTMTGEKVESLGRDGSVLVGASEAVLVTFV